MDMVVMDMVMDMARGKLKPLPLLKPRPPQDIIIMDTPAMDMEDMDTMDMDMERGRLRPMLLLRLDTITDTPTDTPMDMVVMDTTDMVMARERLSPVIIMDTPMDMAMDMVMVMDTMVKQL